MNENRKPESVQETDQRFHYTYSSKEQEEVQRIRRKYVTSEPTSQEDKLEQLRWLDAGVTKKGTTVSLIVGVVSTLILGFGMSCCLVWGDDLFFPGILIGLTGMVGVALAYPIYSVVTERERRKVAPQILKLTEELLQ